MVFLWTLSTIFTYLLTYLVCVCVWRGGGWLSESVSVCMCVNETVSVYEREREGGEGGEERERFTICDEQANK